MRRVKRGALLVLILLFAGVSDAAAQQASDGGVAPGSASAVRPVVLVHGFDSAPRMWRGMAQGLREAGFLPIAVAWRPERRMRVPQAADFVLLPAIARALADAGLPPDAPFDAVGHSSGGLLLRWLVEHPDADVDAATPEGFWIGDGRPDGDPLLASRLRRLVLLATPNQGARTGIARIACDAYEDLAWRELACDLVPDAPVLHHLGQRVPLGDSPDYFSIGVETLPNLLPAPPFDANGDGVSHSHDNAVAAESSWLAGAPHRIWRGRHQRSHFTVSCASTVIGWIVGFLDDGSVPLQAEGPQPSRDACRDAPDPG